MKNFVVLFKPIEVPPNLSSKTLSSDYVQIDYLMQQGGVGEAAKWNDIKTNYEPDEKSISFQTIDGKLCVVMIWFRKG